MKIIIYSFLGLLIGVTGKPSIKIITGLLDDIIHTVSPKTSQNQVPLPYQQNAPYIQYGRLADYTQGNINGNPYQPALYPATYPYFNPYNTQTESYRPTEHYPTTVLDKQSTELYPPSGPAVIYENTIFVQDPPLDDVNNDMAKESNKFQLDVRSMM